MRRTLFTAGLLLGLAPAIHAQLPAGTAFTYQGRLGDAGAPATGSYDFEFRLFDAAASGTQVGGTVAQAGVVVTDGLFTVDLDFGPGAFNGSARWLEVAVRAAGGGTFTTLSPRQRTNGTPYAVRALSIPLAGSGSASTASRSDHDHAGTYAAAGHNHVGQAWSTSADPYGLTITNGSTVPFGAALRGVHGGASGVSFGVQGINTQAVAGAAGVYGSAENNTAAVFGVFGESMSGQGRGVYGLASATSGTTYGVFGFAASTSGWGLFTPNNASVGGSLSLGSASAPAARLDVTGQGRFVAASGAPPFLLPTAYAPGATVANLSSDRLDGLDSTAFSTSVHTHDAADLTSGTVAPARGGTGQTSWATGEMLFASGFNTLARLPVGTSGQVLSVGSGVPAWAAADAHNHLGQTWTTAEHLYALNVVNNSTTGGAAVRAAFGGSAMAGTAIHGTNAQPLLAATGVRGDAFDPSALNFGVYGFSASSNGRGVAGIATATSGQPVGVFGQSGSSTGWGFFTANNSYVGGSLRVGLAGPPLARLDVVGQARIETASGLPPILVTTPYAGGANVTNLSADRLDGLDSSDFASVAHDHGGQAWSVAAGSFGLSVTSTSPTTGGALRGVHNGAGAVATAVEGINSQAVAGASGMFGYTTNTVAVNYGVVGRSQSSQGIGVRGEAAVASGNAWGVFGYSASSGGRGVVGQTIATTGVTYGVYGTTSSTDGFGLYTPDRAHVGGSLTVAGGSVLTGNVAVGGAGTAARLAIVPSSTPGVRELEFTGGVLQTVEVLANNNMIVGTATASDLTLQTGLTSRVVILGLNGMMGIGTGAPNTRLDVEQSGLPVAEFNRTTSDGAVINIAQDGVVEGNISVAGTTVSFNAFTGSHYAWTGEAIERGMLVSMTGENRSLHGREGAEPVYGIVPAARANDPAVLGSYLGRLEPGEPDRPATENPHLVAAVGNGELWVVDAGGDIDPGDALVASPTRGHAMRDDDRFEVSHVVARAAERVRWRDVVDHRDGVKRRLISVLFDGHAREKTSGLRAALARSTLELAELRALLAAQSSRLAGLEEALARAERTRIAAAPRP